MTIDRLSHLHELLEGYYEDLNCKQIALRDIEASEKARIERQIRPVKQKIAEIQDEYLILLKSQTARLDITDADAEIATAEIIQEVEILQYQPIVQGNAELVKLITKLTAELTKPGISYSGKLKAAIPLLPGFVSYEMELDTEGLLQRLLPALTNLAGKLKKI
jgi:hypothetical protein